MSALHRAWLADRAARTVNVLLATASCGHPDAMAAADDINLTLEMLDCATCAPGVRALLRLRTHTEEIDE